MVCPTTIENDPSATPDGCSILLTANSNLDITAITTGTLAYNGSDSTFGIINNSNGVILSLFLMGGDITDFTFNGITTYISANGVPIPPVPPLEHGYETYHGPSVTFSEVDVPRASLLINFTGGLLPGTSTYFSLPGDPQTNVSGLTGPNGVLRVNAAAVPEPSTWVMALISLVIIGCNQIRRRAGRRYIGQTPILASRKAVQIMAVYGVMAGTLLFTPCARAANVVTLPSSPKPEQVAAAQDAFNNGSIVAMNDAAPAAFGTYFNVQLPLTKENPEIPLRYCVVAAHRSAKGRVHTYIGPRVMPGASNLSTCTADLQRWVDGIAKSDFSIYDNKTPDRAAWVQLSMTTMNSKDSSGNFMQETVGIYRGASNNTAVDYYLVTKQMQTGAHFEYCALGGGCYWYPVARGENIAVDAPGAQILDHGPLSANNVSSQGFTIGAGLPFSASASYSVTWNQLNVSTQDQTNPTTAYAAWEDRFNWPGGRYSYNPPDAMTRPWQNEQAVIYSVPAGTPSFNVTVADWFRAKHDNGFYVKEAYLRIDNYIMVDPPTLSTSPKSLNVLPGQTQTLDLSAYIRNNTGETLPWTITNIPGNMIVSPVSGAGTTTISVQVSAGTPPGLAGILNINTDPPFASPDVRRGPLQVPITVVSTSDIRPGVLITGGTDWTSKGISSAEWWDPATGKSTPLGGMTQARVFHTATTLNDGRILLAGGLANDLTLSGSTEFYVPATQRFTVGPGLITPRAYHTASLLADGTVLFTGGVDDQGNAIATAELYNPVDNTKVLVGSMSVGRMKHTATVLPNNTVLISGGINKYDSMKGIDTAEIYNPNTKSFSPAIWIGLSNGASAVASSAILTTGQVLVAAGQYQPGVQTTTQVAYLYLDLFFPVWPGKNQPVNTPNPALIALPNGGALLLGEDYFGTSSARGFGQMFNSDSKAFSGHYTMQENRDLPVGLLIKNTGTTLDGRVVVAGGVMANTGASNGTAIEVFDPSNTTWTTVGAMTTPRRGHTMTLVGAATSNSSTTLTSSLNPSITGQNVVFTVKVSTPGSYVTGTVTFHDGMTPLGTVSVDGGTAQFDPGTLSIGSHNITAVYSGNSFYSGSSSPVLVQVVNPIQVTPAYSNLTPSQTIVYGTPGINLGGTISAPGNLYPPVNSPVSIVIEGVGQNATMGVNGNFSITNFPTASISAGTHQILYTYSGDAQFKGISDNSTNVTVRPATPAFSNLTASQAIDVGTASVTLGGKIAAGVLIPTGSVSISINGNSTAALINADGSFSVNYDSHALAAAATPYVITYSYATQGNFAGVSDTSTMLTVKAFASATSLTSSLNPSKPGQRVTFTATVTATSGTPTGTVTFKDGTNLLGSGMLDNGTATLWTSDLGVGTHSITAVYGGSSSFASSTSSVLTQTVKQLTPTFSNLTASQTIEAGTPSIDLSGVISAPGPVYPEAGEAVVVIIGQVKANATIGSNGTFSLSFPTVGLSAGSYPISYSYAGDANLAAASDSSTNLTVSTPGPVQSRVTLQATPNPAQDGQTVTFTATVPQDVSGVMPTGNVTISEPLGQGNTLIYGNANLVNGVATIVVSSSSAQKLSVGTHTIFATYSGDGVNYSGATSQPYTLIVNPQQ